jgi:hypothetical protein
MGSHPQKIGRPEIQAASLLGEVVRRELDL